MSNYKETDLWRQAKALVVEVYRLTEPMLQEGSQGLKSDLRALARQIAKGVPAAFQKSSGPTGNITLEIAARHFDEFEALTEVAVELGQLSRDSTDLLSKLADPIEARFKERAREARIEARERMSTGIFGVDEDEDED